VAEADAALPPAGEWRMPDGWRAVDFVSDLHLKADLPRTVEAFARYLEHTRADAVLILGDLFEFWPGDDAVQLPFERRRVEELGAAARRRTVAMMVGNRDFLIRPALLQAHGIVPLSDPTVLTGFGVRVLLTHGDALCLGDVAYQQFRRWARDPQTQAGFLARPLAERIALGAQVRHASEAGRSTTPPPGGWGDIDTDAARDCLRAVDAEHLVHGHTHRPADEMLAPGIERHVLADWDFEGTPVRGGVLRLSAAGFERLDPAEA
jgi:UDP-2,3-diacylglucosamine hydrolase